MRKTSVLMLILLLGSSGMLLGQERYGFEIGPYASYQHWKDRSFQVGPPQASPPISLSLGYNDKLAYGLRLNLLSQGHWGGELSYSYQKNTVTLTRQSFTPVALRGGIHHFFYNTVLYPRRYDNSKVMPFVTAGLGVASYQLSDGARARAADPRDYGLGALKSQDNRFAFNYGGGIKVNVRSNLGLRADFRHNFSDVPSYGLPKESSNPAQAVLPIQGKLQNYEVSAGIYFQFLK